MIPMILTVRPGKDRRIPNTVSKEEVNFGSGASLFHYCSQSCLHVLNYENENLPQTPNVYLHQESFFSRSWTYALPITAQKPPISQLHTCHPTPVYAPDPIPVETASVWTNTENSKMLQSSFTWLLLTMTLGKKHHRRLENSAKTQKDKMTCPKSHGSQVEERWDQVLSFQIHSSF